MKATAYFHRLAAIALLLASASACGEPGSVIVDSTGAVVAAVQVQVRTARGTTLLEARSDASGGISIGALPPGAYLLRITAAGFEPLELRLETGTDSPLPPRIELSPERIRSEITVTATPGLIEEITSTPRLVSGVERREFSRRPLPTLGDILHGAPGITVQQSTYGQVSPFLRGLTGYHVLNLIDGVRFNNSTFRSGPNQYLAFIDPSQSERVETLIGPAGSQYGSDSLGGAINVLTLAPRFAPERRWEIHGEAVLFAASADASAGSSASVSLGNRRLSWLVGAAGRRHNDLRAGGGWDSRNVFRRLFGLSAAETATLVGGPQQDTAFSQYATHTKLATRLREDQSLTLWYQYSALQDVRAYKDLLGGLGRLQSRFEPQGLNFFYARYEKLGLAWLDSLSGAFSVNSQRDGSVRQGWRETDDVTRDSGRVNVYGYTFQAASRPAGRADLVFGGDSYDERTSSVRTVLSPLTGQARSQRPLYPDGARYRTLGLYAQSSAALWRDKLRAALGGRLTGVRYENHADPAHGIAASSRSFRDLSFNAALSCQAHSRFAVHGLVAKAFRAPNMNDLGAIGLNDLGYEIPASEAIAAGALLGSSAGADALWLGKAVRKLVPETLWSYEAGLSLRTEKFYGRLQVFDAELHDPIVRRTLLFPAGDLPYSLSSLAVTPLEPTQAQRQQGVRAVATLSDPRAVKAFVNDGRARYYGIESLFHCVITSRWSAQGSYAFLAGRELNPTRPVRRLPPQTGRAELRYVPSGRRPWLALGAGFAGPQLRLSGGDRDDERIGASRRRRDIADFFLGARVAPYLDSRSGVFLPTKETLRQIQDRVLPIGAVINGVLVADDNTRVPLYPGTAGWVSLDLRGGFPLSERISLNLALMNLADRNYRVHGSGIDAPGFHAYIALRYVF